eukprot:g595.t1
MILIDAPIPDYSTQSFRYVLEWDLETFPSPLEFVKSVAMEMRLDDVGIVTVASQIEEQLRDYETNSKDSKWAERDDVFRDMRVDRCLTSIDENVVIESPSPPRSQQSKKRDRPPTPTFEPPQNYYFETKKKKQEETTTTTKRKNSMDSSRERKKKKKTKKKKNNDNPLSKYLDMDQDKLNELYDVSMAYCGKCEEGGDMFCCSGCPGVYHPKCVGLDSVPEDDWYCDWCKSTESNIRDIKNFSKLKDKKRCMRVLSTLRKNDYASVFEHPVEIPGYNMFIKKPMCMSLVQRNLLSGVYDADIRGLFREDVELIFKNCMEFNQPKTGIWRLAQSLAKFYVRTEKQ